MSLLPTFKTNQSLSLGIELELQLIDLQNYNLAMEAEDFIYRLSRTNLSTEIKPEITLGMIELNSSIHPNYTSLLTELQFIKKIITEESAKAHIGICGGGAHPFQKWQEQRIFPTERFSTVSQQYGYLAKQFTVFGQHIHIGCKNGNDALFICHAFARYLPHFVAMSAASPYNQRIDTSFDCSRLTIISAFPLSGTPPWVLIWDEFEEYFKNMFELGIVESMKDFYWDIRPKPDIGTIEIRICDTPLTVDKAADLAAYAQMLTCWLLEARPDLSKEIYSTYFINRFNAARYGLDALLIDPIARKQIAIIEDIKTTCNFLTPYAKKLGCENALDRIKITLSNKENDAHWLRKQYNKFNTLEDVVRHQTKIWRK